MRREKPAARIAGAVVPTLPRAILLSLALLAVSPALGTSWGQAGEVTCPIFIPESPAKYCIIVTGNGCVVVHVSTVGQQRIVETVPCGP